MNKQLLQDVLSSTRLPTPPAIALRIIEMTGDPNVTPADLTGLVQADTGLSSKILRTVNSAFYGLSTPVGSITRAQIMLGMNAIKTLTLGFSLVEALEDGSPGTFDYESYWRRSLHAAACAKAIASKTRCMEPEEALLGGLLQDVGMVVLHRTLGDRYDTAVGGLWGDHRRVSGVEMAEFGASHPGIASILAERWRFPATLITTIRYHEQPTAAPKSQQTAARCVGLAALGASVLVEENPAVALRTFYSKAKAWLSLQPAEADAILEAAGSGARALAKLLEAPSGVATDTRGILEAAKDKLVDINLEEQIVAAVSRERSAQAVDALTGVASRKSFVSMLEDAHGRAIASEGTVTVAALDVDGFRSINDEHGRDVGDSVLIALAGRLREGFGAYGGEVARIGGETFGVILPGIDGATAAAASKRMVEALGEAHEWGGTRIEMSVRLGFTTMDPDTARAFEAPITLLAAAERALEAARSAGGRAVRAFVPQLRAAA